MRLIQSELILLIGIAFCSIRGISRADIQWLNAGTNAKEAHCIKCQDILLGGEKEEDGVSFLTACPSGERHMFHTECFAELCVDMKGGRMQCPECGRDCKALVRQALVNCQDDELMELLRAKMLERMCAIPSKDLGLFFDYMGLMHYECSSIAGSLVGTKYSQIRGAIANYTAVGLFDPESLCEYLVSTDVNYIPAETYEMALIRYICGGSEWQILKALERLLQREYTGEEEKRANAKKFIEVFVSTPRNITLSANTAYELLHALLEHKMTDSVKLMVENTVIVHTMSIPRAADIITQCMDVGSDDGLAMAEHVWINRICMCNPKTDTEAEERTRAMQKISEYLDSPSGISCSAIRKKMDRMKLLAPEAPPSISISEAGDLVKKMASTEQQGFGTVRILGGMITSGMLNALERALPKQREKIFKAMFGSWSADLVEDVYLRLPESVVCSNADLCLLERCIKQPKSGQERVMRCIRLLTRRQYFDYDMFLGMLKILSKAKANGSTDETLCIWLLKAAQHQSLFTKIETAVWDALYKSLGDDKLLVTRAIIKKPIKNNIAISVENMDEISEINKINLAFAKLPAILQADIMYNHYDAYIFTAWCSQAIPFMKLLLSGEIAMDVGLFIMSMCKSVYFEKGFLSSDIDKLVIMLLGHGNAGLRYIDLFIKIAHSKQYVCTVKKELFSFLSLSQMTKEEAASVNEMGIDHKLIRQRIADLSIASKPIVEVFDGVEGRCLLKLVRDKINKASA